MCRSLKRSKRNASLMLGLSLILAACAHPIPTAETSQAVTAPMVQAPPPPPGPSACAAFPRLTFSRLKDTPETIIGIKGYDAARDSLCGVGK